MRHICNQKHKYGTGALGKYTVTWSYSRLRHGLNKAEPEKGAELTQQMSNRPFTEVLPSGFSSFAKQNPRTHL